MASTSCAKQSPLPTKVPSSTDHPTRLVTYEEIVASPKLFISTLEKLHATVGTKFMIPTIGGKELDLHRLFVEVTYRGGIEKIIKEKRWKEVTAVFNFPSTATNASFVLRKYYVSLLHRYEQIYYFRSRDSWQSPSTTPILDQGTVQPSSDVPASIIQQPKINPTELPTARPASTSGYPVIGVIDGKFESGYLVTVTIGSEKLKGVLYQSALGPVQHVQPSHNVYTNNSANACAVSGVQRHRRRKKSEIKRRDPAHPKPNRSGYNFFFAEQHARLKPLHPGKDREISRMIGELWTTINDSEKAIYQEKAVKDKERYRIEMEDYRERLRTGQVISDAIPLRQRLPGQEADLIEAETKPDKIEDSPQTPENDSISVESDFEDDKATGKDLHIKASQAVGVDSESGNVGVEVSAEEPPLNWPKVDDNVGHNRVDSIGNDITRDALVEKAGKKGGESLVLS
ncbi:high mobility group B protein 15-like [Mangifera indica]|uniref:high mobility group B protein 15-like n=1 Tax=Mangifera indica TaxID=29780 RepID=UPI001CFC032C|nr:high mobility group B protein 15-like [Mangifera indica]